MVFPSEVAAEYWRRNAVRSFDEGLVAGNRFVSWDTFKERTLGRHSEARPANSTIRRIFSALVCEGNEDTTRLRALIPPEFAPRSKRFAKSISRLLPFIPQAIDAARQPVWPVESDETMSRTPLVLTLEWRNDDFAILDNMAIAHYAVPDTQADPQRAGVRILHRTTMLLPDSVRGRFPAEAA